MAENTSDQPTKDEIAKGMSESSKGVPPTTRGAGKGPSGPADEMAEGMSEAGSGIPSADQGGGASGGKR